MAVFGILATTPRIHANSCAAGSDAGTSGGSHPAEGRLVLRDRGWLHMGRIVDRKGSLTDNQTVSRGIEIKKLFSLSMITGIVYVEHYCSFQMNVDDLG